MDTYLTQTMTCPECAGMGTFPNEQAETKMCELCNGSGAVIDSAIPNAIKQFHPGINRAILGKITEAILQHIDQKLKDSYQRGLREAEMEKKEYEKNGQPTQST